MPLGGQNLIEALAVGTPVVVGPHTFNFADAAEGAIAAGAALRVADADHLLATLAALLDDPVRRGAMGEAARNFHRLHRGASDRLWAWLAPRLPPRRRAQLLNARLTSSTSGSASVPTACLSFRLLRMKL